MAEKVTTELNALRSALRAASTDNGLGEALYRAFIQQTLDAIYIYDGQTKRLLETNQAFLDLLGYTATEARRLTVYDIVDLEQQRPSVTMHFQEIMNADRASLSERRWRRKDGTLLDVQVSANTLTHGKRQLIFVAGRDITERRRAEQRYRELFEDAPVMYVITESRGGAPVITDCNQLFLETLGYLREEVLGRAITTFYLATGELRTRESGYQLAAQGRYAPEERQLVARDGRVVHTLLRTAPEFNRKGEAVGTRAMYMDVSQTRQAEAELRADAAIHDLARNALGELDFTATVQLLVDQLGEVTGADGCYIALWDEGRRRVIPMAASGAFRETYQKMAVVEPGERTLTQSVVEARRTLVVEETHNSPHISPRLAERFKARAMLGVPLMTGEAVLGSAIIAFNTAHRFTPEETARAERLSGLIAIVISKAKLVEQLRAAHAELSNAYETTLEGLARALELRDKETEGHTQRVTEMTVRLARELGMADEELVHIRRGALLHDIGKIGVPDSVLRKPSALTVVEMSVMRKHPEYAYELISAIEFLYPAIDIPYCHHEKWDGTGYPRGLRGDAIPLAARIFAVVDVWDALSSDRPYRKAWPPEKVMEHLRRLSGTHFDPQVVEAFLKLTDV
jgi:PAS domain S-box-containing protein/putative nucleotidyltransferase with HDIG domain